MRVCALYVCMHACICVYMYMCLYMCVHAQVRVCTFLVYPFPDSFFLRVGSAVTMNHAPQRAQGSTVRLLLQVMATEAALSVGAKKLPCVS